MTLQSWAETYCLRHDASANYCDQVRWAVAAFEKHLGHAPLLEDLTAEAINRWLFAMKQAGLASDTRASRRRVLLMLASEAAREHRIEPVSRDLVARIKTTPRIVDGLSYEEACQIVQRLRYPVKEHRRWLNVIYRSTGICRGDYWIAFILACWDTGAPADLRELKFSDIQPDGRVERYRTKTGKPLSWKLSEGALAAIEDIRKPERDLVFPRSGRLELWRKDARYAIQVIGGSSKSLGDIRSGAGTDAELIHGEGAGCRLLGNTPAVFNKHYAIRRLLPQQAVAPRPLVAG